MKNIVITFLKNFESTLFMKSWINIFGNELDNIPEKVRSNNFF
jgi:hypothetical protein